ncbi:putative conjugative transfer TraU domain protein [Orientia tsutsugamushi str. UT76]|nr:putative conjugative transfer TraU domain protein [Orientia tsutsugamushi str. UT76]
MPDTNASGRLICLCPKPGIPIPVPGIPVGFWEPVRLVDVTKSPSNVYGKSLRFVIGSATQKGRLIA